MRSLSCALAVTFGSLLAACSAGSEDASESSDLAAATSVGAIAPGTFKLYRLPGATPDPQCDGFTRLDLTNGGGKMFADLADALEGACEIGIVPNERRYELRLTGTECGSRTYEATERADGMPFSLKITDHRKRECRDRVEARVIVEEASFGAPAPRVFYSYDAEPPSFCARALCAPGTRCNEAARRCEPVQPPPRSFCATALCAPNTRCDEAQRRCVAVE